jgi:2-desacetyl-2-hydroxyethyl bacteriochlorophyllide A dehydrogenase
MEGYTMKGLIVNKIGELKIVNDIPEPEIGEYDALVENIACGICNGTDMKIIVGHFKGFNSYPCVLGHEACGRIVKLGRKVKNYKLGDYVLCSFIADGPKYASGWGGFSEFGFVTDYHAMVSDGARITNPGSIAQQVIPASFDPNKALMLITFREVLSGMKRFGVSAGMRVMINGSGPVGLSMVKICKLLGVHQLIVSDQDENRLSKAKELGADKTLNFTKVNIESTVKELVPEGLDVFIDAVGLNDLMNLGLKLVKFNGKVAVYGVSPVTEAHIDWSLSPYNFNIQFVQWPTREDEASAHDMAVEFVRSGAINLDDFVTHILPLEDYEQGFDLVKTKKGLKVSLKLRS